jgi:hypothetical protein
MPRTIYTTTLLVRVYQMRKSGLTFREIAEKLNQNIGTVRYWYLRALALERKFREWKSQVQQ